MAAIIDAKSKAEFLDSPIVLCVDRTIRGCASFLVVTRAHEPDLRVSSIFLATYHDFLDPCGEGNITFRVDWRRARARVARYPRERRLAAAGSAARPSEDRGFVKDDGHVWRGSAGRRAELQDERGEDDERESGSD